MSDIELTVASVTSKRVQKHHHPHSQQQQSSQFSPLSSTNMSSPSAPNDAPTTPMSMVSSDVSESGANSHKNQSNGNSISNSSKNPPTKQPPQNTIQMMTMDHEEDRIWRPPTPQGQQPDQSTFLSAGALGNSDCIVQDQDSSWWKRGVQRLLTRSTKNDNETRLNSMDDRHTETPDHDGEDLGYASLNDGYGNNVDPSSPSRLSNEDGRRSNTSSPAGNFVSASLLSTPKRKSRGTNGSLRTSLLEEAQQPSHSVDALQRGGDSALSLSSPPPPRSPDDLHDDCSFFFRDEDMLDEADGSRRNKRGFRVLRQHEHRTDFSYKDAVDVLAPTFLNQYKTRYEQLNQDLNHEGDAGPNCLCLDAEDDANSEVPSEIIRTKTAIHSSLFYQHQGRVLMKLPVDHVRLFMDPDLEAGVLSVEQIRTVETDLKFKEGDERPQLRYVMTVDDNLYKRIVTEMSDSLVKPYCGIGRCGNGKEKADIWIACAILFLTLTLFFINVLIWGPHQ